MSDKSLILNGSPTLAGIKTGNIFTVEYDDYGELVKDIREVNNVLRKKGVRMIPLRTTGSRMLAYLYRPSKLRDDYECEQAQEILMKCGYPKDNVEQGVNFLIKRLKEDTFPHEIGLFLGYPPADVKGFIENEAQNFKIVGEWKVYKDEKTAKEKFESFKRCSRTYKEKWEKGNTLESLTVAL